MGNGVPESRNPCMITATRCKELANHYKALSSSPGISESRAFLLRNIARSLVGLAGQLERLDTLTKEEGAAKKQTAALLRISITHAADRPSSVPVRPDLGTAPAACGT